MPSSKGERKTIGGKKVDVGHDRIDGLHQLLPAQTYLRLVVCEGFCRTVFAGLIIKEGAVVRFCINENPL
jgi:hypothetical protein